jgi:hypothetical protein
MKRNLFALIPLVAAFAGPLMATSVQVEWRYQDVPPAMHLYEVGGKPRPMLWETGNGKKLEELPVAAEITAPTLEISPGSKRRFVLVYHNVTGSTIRFFAAPHAIEPAASALGVKFKCLCVNRAYEVPAGQWWYRVVELRINKGQAGGKLAISHQLIAVSKQQMDEINQAPEMENGQMMDGM